MNQQAAKQDQVQKFYDCEAESYDASRYESQRGRRRDRFHKEVLARLLDDPTAEESATDRQLLEVGCGTGRFLAALAAAGQQVTGTDLSQKMLDQARVRLESAGIDNVSLIQTSSLPFPDSTFSAVYSIFVVNLVPDYNELFAKVARVLKPDGLFVFNVPNLTSCYWPFGVVINRRQRTSTSNAVGGRYSHWFSRREWRDSLGHAGFRVESVLGEPPWCGVVEQCAPLSGELPAASICKSLFIRARLNRSVTT